MEKLTTSGLYKVSITKTLLAYSGLSGYHRYCTREVFLHYLKLKVIFLFLTESNHNTFTTIRPSEIVDY